MRRLFCGYLVRRPMRYYQLDVIVLVLPIAASFILICSSYFMRRWWLGVGIAFLHVRTYLYVNRKSANLFFHCAAFKYIVRTIFELNYY